MKYVDNSICGLSEKIAASRAVIMSAVPSGYSEEEFESLIKEYFYMIEIRACLSDIMDDLKSIKDEPIIEQEIQKMLFQEE